LIGREVEHQLASFEHDVRSPDRAVVVPRVGVAGVVGRDLVPRRQVGRSPKLEIHPRAGAAEDVAAVWHGQHVRIGETLYQLHAAPVVSAARVTAGAGVALIAHAHGAAGFSCTATVIATQIRAVGPYAAAPSARATASNAATRATASNASKRTTAARRAPATPPAAP